MNDLEYIQHGCSVREHRLDVPLDYAHNRGSIELFAREVIPPGGEHFPPLLFLQGGPGGEGPRPANFRDIWMGAALKTHRLILMDQRGTGQSSPLFSCNVAGSDGEKAEYLSLFLQENIIRDAEALREALNIKRWTTLGQSYGGFLTLAYLSLFPDSIEQSFITGGLPGLVPLDQIYTLSYSLTAARNEEYFKRYPRDETTIRHIAAHLSDTVEYLPTGERLSSQRFRSLGQNLGMSGGFDTLHYLFEGPFISVRGEKRLSPAFLAAVGAQLSQAGRPLYYVLQEAIYGPTTPEGTRWSAERLAKSLPGFSPDTDPLDQSTPWYLTGEHVSRALLEEDPALSTLLGAVDVLAQRTDWPQVYDLSMLSSNTVPVAAAVYYDDMFVPRKLSMDTATLMGATRTWVTSEYQHDGLRMSGPRVFEHLENLIND
ncbi:alpha/beta hydrolase [Actinomycetaceae bacterium WB03_NA08]|uniref:Alpha/beta hydrolase n=1 Tax=Scrofimicrobium canadense TaxID=2652290 RepID=A0A6N7W827_9ACTO|nr:alpha/beta fold hydrolase [Scrofimicrobium canadense]MSS84416.1 alpha/beta hydrolase [Scrofimicrobium canadense]